MGRQKEAAGMYMVHHFYRFLSNESTTAEIEIMKVAK